MKRAAWSKLILVISGMFLGGAIDHVILGIMQSPLTPFGVHSGVLGNWLFALFDLIIGAGLLAFERSRLAKDDARKL